MRPRRVKAKAPSAATWNVVITEWALDSYLSLKHQSVFTSADYWNILRPDVELLRDGIPSTHAKFQLSSFWGPATQGGITLANGFKMKWHNLGPGGVQLRLPILSGNKQAFLCEAYVKASAAVEQRKLARFKTHMNLISLGRYVHRGSL